MKPLTIRGKDNDFIEIDYEFDRIGEVWIRVVEEEFSESMVFLNKQQLIRLRDHINELLKK